MSPFLVLAHGALGVFDELIFVLVGVVFVGLIVTAWIRSRRSEPEAADPAHSDEPLAGPDVPAGESPDHFPLS
jgi:hypothetical protein